MADTLSGSKANRDSVARFAPCAAVIFYFGDHTADQRQELAPIHLFRRLALRTIQIVLLMLSVVGRREVP